MSYQKLGFTSGQTLKAEHLNHMEEGIEAASASAGNKVIILETSKRDAEPEYYFYNGENLDGDFVLDCLLSGYQFIIKYNGCYYSMQYWHTDEYGKVVINTKDNSLSPIFTITTA